MFSARTRLFSSTVFSHVCFLFLSFVQVGSPPPKRKGKCQTCWVSRSFSRGCRALLRVFWHLLRVIRALWTDLESDENVQGSFKWCWRKNIGFSTVVGRPRPTCTCVKSPTHVCCSVLQCVEDVVVYCSALQCVTVCVCQEPCTYVMKTFTDK